jgi:hypothetical protein
MWRKTIEAANIKVNSLTDDPRRKQMLGGLHQRSWRKGDVFKPVEYVITPFMCSEYAHGTEETSEYFHSARIRRGGRCGHRR